MEMKKALIVVDVQRDFCQNGALPAFGTETLLVPLHELVSKARARNVLTVFTQDWHPHDHQSFAQNGGEWPVHCLSGSSGAELMPPLVADDADILIFKGRNRMSCD